MATVFNATGTNGLQLTPDNSYSVTFQGASSLIDFYVNGDVRVATSVAAGTTVNAATDMNAGGNITAVGTVVMGSSFLRNRIINGAFEISQYYGSSFVTGGVTNGYVVDRWIAAASPSASAAGQVATDPYGSGNTYVYKFTGTSTNTSIALIQRIESYNIADLAGKTVTLSATFSNTLLSTVSWAAYYPTAQDNYASVTAIASGTFATSPVQGRSSVQIALPAGAANGLEIIFSVANQTSGSWVISQVQLEAGSIPTAFERRPISQELALCQRYYNAIGQVSVTGLCTSGAALTAQYSFPVTMRGAPTPANLTASATTNISTSLSSTVLGAAAVVIVGTGTSGSATNSSFTAAFSLSAEL